MRKKVIMLLLCIVYIVILSFNNSTYATSDVKVGEYSQKYKEWLALSDEEKEGKIAPLPFNVRNTTTNESKRGILKSNNITIPERFDLREHINIEVKNQMTTGLCWGFSSSTSLETNLALKGKEYNFSERHFDYSTANNYIDEENPEGLNRKIGDGGDILTAFTYLSRGNGPILEEDMPFEDNERRINLFELPKNQAVQHVGDLVYLSSIWKDKDENGKTIFLDPNGEEYSEDELKEARDFIKQHIMKNGSIVACVNSPQHASYNSSNYSDNYCEYSNWADHAVSIIGWDDNYDKNNFINVPDENGAYIVLNSWGNEFGDNGVYYVSYEDAFIETELTAELNVNDISYDKIYQYDMSPVWNQLEAKYAANVYTAENDSKLTEVMIGSTRNGICNIYVNNSGEDLNINNLTKVANNVEIHGGYTQIQLDTVLNLTKNTKFAIVIECISDDFGVGIEDSSGYGYSNVNSNLGESFCSNDGINWNDIYEENDMKNFSIKGFVQNSEEILKIGNINGIGYANEGGIYAFTIYSSYLEKDKDVDVLIYKGEENVSDKFEITGTKIRGNGTYIKLKCNSEIQDGEYSVKVQLDDKISNVETFSINEKTEDLITIQFNDINFFENMSTKLKNFTDYEKMRIITTKEDIESVTDLGDLRDKNITDITRN